MAYPRAMLTHSSARGGCRATQGSSIAVDACQKFTVATMASAVLTTALAVKHVLNCLERRRAVSLSCAGRRDLRKALAPCSDPSLEVKGHTHEPPVWAMQGLRAQCIVY